MLKFIFLLSLFCANAFAAVDLGKELQIQTSPQDGHYQLGVHYSYDGGIIGDKFQIEWGILFGTTISQQEVSTLPEQIKWNVFNSNTNRFFADWATQPTIYGKDLFLGTVDTDGDLAKNIIVNQANVILVFADLTGKPLYNINVGALCQKASTYFQNLTDMDKSCAQVSVADIDQAKKSFCDDRQAGLLDEVKNGTIACDAANKEFQSAGCGSLSCQ
jgi:hypothetical protein